uniref:Uncharacterized protein n=2 Tax=Caenorhabditis japonica TaxID=281687 RepID=A0A8R1HPZ6_CAEJA
MARRCSLHLYYPAMRNHLPLIFENCVGTATVMFEMFELTSVKKMPTVLSDVLVGGLITPYMFFPVLVGIGAGVFTWISIPISVQVFFAQIGLGGVATSIVMLFENRHNTLVRGKWKIEAEWIRYTFYAINAIYSVLFLLPCYFRIPDAEWAKPILLKVVCDILLLSVKIVMIFQILPCPHPSYFQDDVFVLTMDISTVTGTAGIYMLFMISEALFLCIHSTYFLMKFNSHMSVATRKLQRKFFVDMIFQKFLRMSLSVIVRENAKSEYKILLRNTTIYDLAVKIVNPIKELQLERVECLLRSNKFTHINVLGTPSRQDLKSNKLPVLIYCRAIYPFNRKNIRQWIEGLVPDKPHHLVQSLYFSVDDSEFSAKLIVIDLPGKSTMVESTGYAIKMKNSKMVLRTFLEHDVASACPMEPKSVLKSLPKVAKPDQKKPIDEYNTLCCKAVTNEDARGFFSNVYEETVNQSWATKTNWFFHAVKHY